MRRLELVDVTIYEGCGLVQVPAAANQIHEGVRVVLALADRLKPSKNMGGGKGGETLDQAILLMTPI